MVSLVEQALPWLQILSTFATVAAAVAAWLSANAARSTARSADETSRHATEALSRATMPRLEEIRLSGGDDRSREPQQMMLYVRNGAPHPGVIVAAKIERTDGHRIVTMVGPSVRIGTRSTPEWVAYIPLSGPIARLHPDAQEATSTEEPGVFLACAVDFTDASGLVTWRQHLRLHEKVSFPVTREEAGTGVLAPVYSYDWWDRPEPEIVSARDSLTARPVGWVRRTWRARPPGWVRRTWHRVW